MKYHARSPTLSIGVWLCC
ncbi:Protein of unknown function [Leuconostoc citreum LBAE C11]|nr:Protein of unknown function [Leuconostoc citreum LBAE C11]